MASRVSPAKIAEIRTNPEVKQALVIVEDDQLSLAIGKRGQNVRLAGKLTGWELEIQSKSQLSAAEIELRAVPGVGPTMETRLQGVGITTVQQLAASTVQRLTSVKGIGAKTAERLIESAKRALETRAASRPSEAADGSGAEAGLPPISPPADSETAEPPSHGSEAPDAAAQAEEEAQSTVPERQEETEGRTREPAQGVEPSSQPDRADEVQAAD